jgi:hypothetical protein
VTMKAILTGLSAIAAIASAILWLMSATARVPYKDRFNPDGSPIGTISDGKTDFILTAAKQGKLNAWAAGAAAVTAALQAWVILL